ncbi:hypothetical protein PGTUg99_036293 [Puccinia graminis f. sp. tritici]|uniref:SCP domain-containing protein n=1 Tax=Puccinia graminis f. sp. tritici TaxID=56615 RepID=A0A5B0SJ64_PUCGR|nr:hypothetical protein PGTUg99_036293 [Puccinia graminis f. sp. tritici]
MLLRLQPHLLLQKVPAPIPATVPIEVVWKTAATVGCAVKKCATLPGVPFKLIDTFYYVCNYSGPLDAPTDFASNMHAKKGQCLKKPTPPNPTS